MRGQYVLHALRQPEPSGIRVHTIESGNYPATHWSDGMCLFVFIATQPDAFVG